MPTSERMELRVLNGAMHCDSCATRIQRVLSPLRGVREVLADYRTQKVTLTVDRGGVRADEVRAMLARAGFPVE